MSLSRILGKMRQFVATILINKENSVLAQHRDNIPTILGPNTWMVPGGAKEESDKDLKTAAARELLEETDYIINPKDLTFLTKDIYTTEEGITVERIIFWALYDGKQEIHCNEGQEMKFITEKDLDILNIYTGHKGFFKKAIELVK